MLATLRYGTVDLHLALLATYFCFWLSFCSSIVSMNSNRGLLQGKRHG
jgi:hypothetical protein